MPPVFTIDLSGSIFEDKTGERSYALANDNWHSMNMAQGVDTFSGAGAIAVQSADKKQVLCMVWNRADHVFLQNGTTIGVALTPIEFNLDRRYHIRGKIYLFDGSMDVLKDKINKETKLLVLSNSD